MSDMYLVLRHRVSEVKQWATLGTEVMKEARLAKGWSYETAARQIPVSSKTYERYEKKGAVPTELVDRVADILDLEIERPAFRRTVTLASGQPATLADVQDDLAEVQRQLSEVLRRLPVLALPHEETS